MQQNIFFSILDKVESTNNYAMQQIQAALATHGQAWLAKEQWGGKGQRGKKWISQPGQNVLLSIAVVPNKALLSKPFILSMLVANVCKQFFADFGVINTSIKWPNDIFFGDRKAGGILIENIYKGSQWQWAVIGIGININQTEFNNALLQATSLKKVIGTNTDVEEIAKAIHITILQAINSYEIIMEQLVCSKYNSSLYQKDKSVILKKANANFCTTIKEVNIYGQLITSDVVERTFNVGEVEWVLKV